MNRIGKSSWNFLALSLVVALSSTFAAGKSSEGKSATGLSSLPPDAQGAISAALGKDDSGYWVHPSANGFRGENPRHALVAEFTRRGAEVRVSHPNVAGFATGVPSTPAFGVMRWGTLGWVMDTRAYGYGEALRPLKAVAPQANANRVEYRRDGVTEWYENGPLGLEQGFTLAHPPGKANGQPLTLELALSGDLAAALEPAGVDKKSVDKKSKSLELRGKNGQAALRYTGLNARDATGRELPSWLEIRGERLLVRVNDAGARYPVVVDPWIQQAELTASDGAANDLFGCSVAVDGNTGTIVVGANQHPYSGGPGPGAAYVFVDSGGTWTQQAELTASDGAAGDNFGGSVGVSGSTAVVGANNHTVGSNQHQGAAYVFVQNGTTWTQQAELTASDGAAGDNFGGSVAISGSTAVVGTIYHASTGAAYVFVQSGETWTQQAELIASDAAAYDWFGNSVAVDGSTALVGAFNKYAGEGAAYVFVESGGTWTQQAEVVQSDPTRTGDDHFGWSVGVSGSTAVVGAPYHWDYPENAYEGSAYVFVESGGAWTQQAELIGSDSGVYDFFGSAVAVSGNTVLVSTPHHGGGEAYVFVGSGGTWTQQPVLNSSDGGSGDSFGYSAAVSGSIAVVGALYHQVGSNGGQGAAYVFGPGSGNLSLTLFPTSLNFEDEVPNKTTPYLQLTATNTGNVAVNFNSITTSGDFAISGSSCGATLNVNASCSVSVTFTPLVLGALTGTLTFTDNASNSPQTAALSGTGVKVIPVTLVPTSWHVGQKVGRTSTKTFTLTNHQKVTLTSIAISTTGPFAVSATTCGASLAPKSKCKISVTFTPPGTGTWTGQLSVSDSAPNSFQWANLAGHGRRW